MTNITSKIEKIILNPTKKELIFLAAFAVILLLLVFFILFKINNKPSVKGAQMKKTSKVTPSLKPTASQKKTD